MTESEKFDVILTEIKGVKTEMQDMKTEMQGMKTEMQDVRTEMQDMKTEMQDMKTEMQDMKTHMQEMDSQLQDVDFKIRNVDRRLTSLVLHVENGTDKNIQLVAENFVELTKKLNEAISVADNRIAYEVKVNYAVDELNKLKKKLKI